MLKLTDVHGDDGLENVVRVTLRQIRGDDVAVGLWALIVSDARSSQHAPQLVAAGLLIVVDVDAGDHRVIGRLVSEEVVEESEHVRRLQEQEWMAKSEDKKAVDPKVVPIAVKEIKPGGSIVCCLKFSLRSSSAASEVHIHHRPHHCSTCSHQISRQWGLW
jgi:hypothetical protein